MMSNFRWLHLSDLHFNQFDNRADSSDLREKLIRSLRTLHGRFTDLRYVFITGDIADKGEYSSNTNGWMRKLMDEFEYLGVSRENVFWCCGNHDIPRSGLKHQNIIRMFVNCVRDAKPSYEEVMNNLEDRELILNCRIKSYLDKHQEYLGRTVNPKSQEFDQIHFFYPLDELNLIVLNTCITSLDDDDERNLSIMEGRLYDVFNYIDDRKPTFVIGHHGLEFLSAKDQETVGRLFDDSHVDYYLCGHAHKLSCRELPNLSTGIREFAAGGMLADGYAQAVYYLGEYSVARHGVHLTPYVYGEKKIFEDNYKYDRAFSENKWYIIERFQECTKETVLDLAGFKKAKQWSQEINNILRKGQGRLAGMHVDDNIIPDAKRHYFESFVSSTDTEVKVKLLDIVATELEGTNGIVLTGEGGAGKTTALLRIWEEELRKEEYVPVYIPLCEYNAVRNLKSFINTYLENKYHIDIAKATYRILMLLDGFNEITERQSEAAREINTLLIQYSAKLKIIITSRREMELYSLLNIMNHYVLTPLDEYTVRAYLEETGVAVSSEVIPVLITPMMLTLYTSTCFIQSEVRKRLLVDFMRADSKAAVIYNYLLCQLGKVLLDNQETDILSAYSHIFFAAPYIAYNMEKSGSFFIDMIELRPLEHQCRNVFDEDYILESAGNLLGSIVYHEQRNVNINSMLVYRQHMLMEEEKRYFFRHQHFRDFLAALNIVNYLKKDVSTGIELLKDRRLPETVLEMLWGMNTIIGIEEWRQAFDVLRNLDSCATGYAISNILMIISGMHKKGGLISLRTKEGDEKWYFPVMAEMFERLDFESVRLYGLNFSGFKNAVFIKSRLSLPNFISQGHHSSVTCVQYFPSMDGHRVALTTSLDGDAKEWDLERGECIAVYHVGGALTYGAYGKSGNYIFVANTNHVIYRLARSTTANADKTSSEGVIQYHGHTKDVKRIDVCSDGKSLITVADDKTIQEWSVESDTRMNLFEGSESVVCVARYSVCNRYIISGAKNGEVRIWDRKNAYTLFGLKAHKKSITDISIRQDGICFLTASNDTLVKEWRMIFSEDGRFKKIQEEPVHVFKGHSNAVTSVHYNGAGDKVLTSSNDSKIILWDCQSSQILKKYEIHSNRVNWVAFSPKEDKILSADYSGQITETEVETNEIRFNIKGVDDRNNCMIKVSDDFVLVGTSDGMIKEWDVSRHICRRIFPGHDNAVKCISGHGDRFYTAGEDKKLYAWSYSDGLIERVVQLNAVPRSMDISDDGERLVIGFDDYSIVEFGAFELNLRKVYHGVNGVIEGIKYLNGHDRFVSVSKDRIARLWHSGVDDSDIIYKCTGNSYLLAIGYDCIKNTVYISDKNVVVELDGDNFTVIHNFEGHKSTVGVINVDSTKRKILSCAFDGRVREWDLDNYALSQDIADYNNRISGAVYCGEHIITTFFNGTIGIWDKTKIWRSKPYGRINIAGCIFRECIFADDEVGELIIENGGVIE